MLVLLFVGIGAADRGYFPCHEHGGLCSAARYRGLSVGAFVSAASRGEPFVVEDAARGMPLANISCAEMGTRFAGGFMRREYDPNGGEGDYVLPIADAGQWARQPVRGQRQDFELDPEAPQSVMECAVLTEGVLTATPLNIRLPLQVFDEQVDVSLFDGIFEMEFVEDGLYRGRFGGGIDIAALMANINTFDGVGDEVFDLLDSVLGINADLMPNEGGVCERLSVAFEFEAASAYFFVD